MPLHTKKIKSWLTQRINPDSSFELLSRFPSFFEIETVYGCNARCTMCPAVGGSKKIMTEAFFGRIAEQIAPQASHIRKVNLFRNGEPFLDPHLEERVRILKDLGVQCVSITSNMSLGMPDRVEALLRNGLDVIDISIDSIEKKTYEGIRKGLRFETVMNNITDFITLRDKLGSHCLIRIRMVLQKSNQQQWDSFRTFWTSKLAPGDTVLYHPIHNWGNQLNSFQAAIKPQLIDYPCVSLWSLLPVLVDGTVPLCNIDYASKVPLGDLNSQTIAEIWNGQVLAKIRSDHLEGRRNMYELCKGCNVWEFPSHLREGQE